MAFLITVLLLVTSDSFAFKRNKMAESEQQAPGSAGRAEESFRDALNLSATKDRELTLQRLQEAMSLWEQGGRPERAAQAALQIGDRYKQTRRYNEAIYHYKQALSIRSMSASVRLNALNSIGSIYAQLYQSDLALPYFIEALKQARASSDLPAQVFVLKALAEIHHRQGNESQALKDVEQAQNINKQRNAETDATLLYLLGQVKQKEGAAEKAKVDFEEALAIYRRQDNAEGQVKTLCSISNILLHDSHKEDALEQAAEAVGLAEKYFKLATNAEEKATATDLKWRSMVDRARAERAVGRKEEALKSYKMAIAQFEGVWLARYMNTEASAIASREEVQPAYREYVNLLMERGKVNEAYDYVESAKSRAILALTTSKQTTSPSDSHQQAETLAEQSRLVARKRNESLSSDLSPAQRTQLQRDISDAERKLQEAQVQAEMAYSKVHPFLTILVSAEKLQEQMTHDQSALVEFFLEDNCSYAWFFAHGEVFVETLPPRQEIESAVTSYLSAINAQPNYLQLEKDLTRLRKQSAALFSRLFGSLSKHIEPGQRLILVPDGLLHYLPFETLINDERYLIEDHEIVYTPSASMLEFLQKLGGTVDTGDRMELLAIGDPVFEPAPKTLGGKVMKVGSKNAMRQNAAARGFHLSPLPRTRDEIEYIANLFPPDRRKLLMERDSTEEALKHESLRRYRRLHFATHSLIDEKSPLRSAVVLTPDYDTEEDGFLEVGEISRMNLDCDLVVVSACQTGRGQLLSGEGIVGLSRAFLRAGARSVVVSLWNVTDISTSQLMKNFYQNMTGGLSNAASLRKAKLQLLNGSNVTRHPYYWSPFVIIGKP